jgi:hypothetical protein
VSWSRFARVTSREAVVAVKEISKGSQIVWDSATKALADPPSRSGGEAVHAAQR